MKLFKVRVVEGTSATQENQSQFVGFAHPIMDIEAEDRVDVYVKLANQLTRDGQDISIVKTPENSCLTDEEIASVRRLGIPFNTGLPESGFQIEFIADEAEYAEKYAALFR